MMSVDYRTIALDEDAQVTLREATALDGMRRQLMRDEAMKLIAKSPEMEEAERIIRLVVVPDLTCCLTDARGLPQLLDYESISHMPERWINAWSAAVYALNPHFLGADKKKSSPTPAPQGAGSTSGSKPRKSKPARP